jgi:hypothetical protein
MPTRPRRREDGQGSSRLSSNGLAKTHHHRTTSPRRSTATNDGEDRGSELESTAWCAPKLPTPSDAGPSDPALRANPFPEVTDPACRLPLPTLFHRPEAVHLGDLLRIWVRTGERIVSLPRIFKVRRKGTGRLVNRGAFRKLLPHLGTIPFRGFRSLPRKENSSRASRRRLRVRLRCRL